MQDQHKEKGGSSAVNVTNGLMTCAPVLMRTMTGSYVNCVSKVCYVERYPILPYPVGQNGEVCSFEYIHMQILKYAEYFKFQYCKITAKIVKMK